MMASALYGRYAEKFWKQMKVLAEIKALEAKLIIIPATWNCLYRILQGTFMQAERMPDGFNRTTKHVNG